jgi:uncharacterized membrane protein YdjX (TVP38/TMEM64 family)
MNLMKAYVYVIVSSVVLLAELVFAALQWGSTSRFSAYGPEVPTRTVYLVLASAGGGLLAYWLCRLLARGTAILWKARRERQRIASEVRRTGGR